MHHRCLRYRDWVLHQSEVSHLPKMQRLIILRFRKRNNAEDHLRLLKSFSPAITYELVFDLPVASSIEAELTQLQREYDPNAESVQIRPR